MRGLNFAWIPRKPWSVTLTCDLDYYQFFRVLKQQTKTCYLFESLEMPRHQDRYYSMGFDPAVVFTGKGDTLEVKGEAQYVELLTGEATDTVELSNVNPYQVLRDSVGHEFKAFATGHQGGLIGYFTHETVNCMEPCLNLEEDKDFGLFKQGLYLDGFLFDSTTHELTYYSYESKEIREQKLARIQSIVDSMLKPDYEFDTTPLALESVEFKGLSETKEEFIEAVERTIQKIADGFSFQAEVGFKSLYHIKGDKFAVYEKLRVINPSPYMFYVSFDHGDTSMELMGASPEILLSQSAGMLLTTPTAGTIHRGKTPAEDAVLGRQLLSDPKEIAEHNMLVDLHRNDLARVSIPGSVKVSDLMYLIKFSHVQHIVSNVISHKTPESNGFDTLASLFPGGVVTGAPKIETIKIIDENEHLPRGPYGGAVGRMSFNGDAVYALAIRSLFCNGDECFAQTSAGVVYDSHPEKEYQEVCNKLAAMKQTLHELGGGA
ncbi:MAG TPA: anthranilate synthase component I [Gammaproteobacteria bacterium]|mgnify:CR=1 FL=1|nr:anthranilate synthase component I [Gammaproteobacteria bacterium]HBF07270.1 anthranilate synthase component I [Gammaproteobacteria bacterium]HCK91727.1 anthranilate synthase component I [Gammaproteobacteria bacterium]|tara:strand:+ start:19800 stop:21269 length:1470 start_codon:yes stop_codon:yes gene_type:complete